MSELLLMLGLGMLAAGLLLMLFPSSDGGMAATLNALSREARRPRSASPGRRASRRR